MPKKDYGEQFGVTPADLEDRKNTLKHPKSGEEMELVFILKKVAARLKDYIWVKGIEDNKRICPKFQHFSRFGENAPLTIRPVFVN